MKNPNDSLLFDFTPGFLGYGNPEGDYRFVGMEEKFKGSVTNGAYLRDNRLM